MNCPGARLWGDWDDREPGCCDGSQIRWPAGAQAVEWGLGLLTKSLLGGPFSSPLATGCRPFLVFLDLCLLEVQVAGFSGTQSRATRERGRNPREHSS